MHKNRLCLRLTEKTIDQNLKIIKKYIKYIDLAELRADFLSPAEWKHLKQFPDLVNIPVILTLRRSEDGGQFREPENIRQEILKKAASGKYSFVDVEENVENAVLEKIIHNRGGRIIRSFHDFSGFPHNLKERIKKLQHTPGDIPKAAVYIKNTKDLIKIIELCKEFKGSKHDNENENEKIIIGMGPFGFITRILSSHFGSYLSFSSITENKAAPGHTDPVTFQEVYRFRQINEKTKIFGIIGNPVMHSLSPQIHNMGFARVGMDAVYLPIQIDRIEDFFPLAQALDIKGVSVTIPHKESVIPYLKSKEDDVNATGACNTMIKQESGWRGSNTDTKGFIIPLMQVINGNPLTKTKTNIKTAVVIGAGGAARAVVYMLSKAGITVLILNRTGLRAKELADTFGCEWDNLSSSGIRKAKDYNDIIIQTTSVGMEGHIKEDPFRDYIFDGHEIVYDIIYKPPVTEFLKRASKAGCEIIPGKKMLIAQALYQFKLFTGKDFPEPENINKYIDFL